MWAVKAATWESFEAVREHRLGAWSTLLTYQNLCTLSECFLPCWKISPWPNQAEKWDLQGWLSHKSSALIKNIMLFGERMFLVEEWIQHPSSDHVPCHVRPSTPLLLYRARKCSSHTAAFSWTSYPPEALKNKLLLIMNYSVSDAITAPNRIGPALNCLLAYCSNFKKSFLSLLHPKQCPKHPRPMICTLGLGLKIITNECSNQSAVFSAQKL